MSPTPDAPPRRYVVSSLCTRSALCEPLSVRIATRVAHATCAARVMRTAWWFSPPQPSRVSRCGRISSFLLSSYRTFSSLRAAKRAPSSGAHRRCVRRRHVQGDTGGTSRAPWPCDARGVRGARAVRRALSARPLPLLSRGFAAAFRCFVRPPCPCPASRGRRERHERGGHAPRCRYISERERTREAASLSPLSVTAPFRSVFRVLLFCLVALCPKGA